MAQLAKRLLYRVAPNWTLNRLTRARMPRVVVLEATTACNLTCPLCPTHYVPRTSRFMAAEQVQDVIDSCGGSLRTMCFHIQGEPLVHPELFDFVRRCSAAGVQTWFGSNGMLLDRHLDEVFDSGLGVISIDIDGVDPTDYEKYRRGGDFERVVANTRALIAEKQRRGSDAPVIQVQTIMFSYNEARKAEVEDFLASFGADVTCMKQPSYFHDIEQGKRLGMQITEAAQRKADEAAAGFLSLVDHEDESLEFARSKVVDERTLYREQRICPQLEKATVLSDGRVVPCCMDAIGLSTFGDLNEQSFAEAWRGEAHAAVLDEFLRGELEVCKTCTLALKE